MDEVTVAGETRQCVEVVHVVTSAMESGKHVE